jgi:hypothetical protein
MVQIFECKNQARKYFGVALYCFTIKMCNNENISGNVKFPVIMLFVGKMTHNGKNNIIKMIGKSGCVKNCTRIIRDADVRQVSGEENRRTFHSYQWPSKG